MMVPSPEHVREAQSNAIEDIIGENPEYKRYFTQTGKGHWVMTRPQGGVFSRGVSDKDWNWLKAKVENKRDEYLKTKISRDPLAETEPTVSAPDEEDQTSDVNER